MALATLEILSQRSATLFDWASDGRTFHLTHGIHNNSGIIFKVYEHAVLLALVLADDDTGMTFLQRSGFSFLTVAITISPTQADGMLLRRSLIPFTEMMYRFFASVFSVQLTVAATSRPSDILNLFPADETKAEYVKMGPLVAVTIIKLLAKVQNQIILSHTQ